ncbi:hypothetical protein SUGI_0170340 [Cryptomeria japonica]|nr:hypothetical protein SUGI_0170340 [Cryptomeria japonica]
MSDTLFVVIGAVCALGVQNCWPRSVGACWVGIDDVKVDVIHILELLSKGLGGRVELAKAYFNGLSESARKYFKGNGVIASMEHCNNFVYLGTE